MLVITGHATVLLGHAMISVDLCRTCENTSLSPLPPKKIASHSPIFFTIRWQFCGKTYPSLGQGLEDIY